VTGEHGLLSLQGVALGWTRATTGINLVAGKCQTFFYAKARLEEMRQ